MRKNIPVPISLTPELLELIDQRAASLGLTRSAYVQQLTRKDLGMSSMALPEPNPPSSKSTGRAAGRAAAAKKRGKKKQS